MNDSTRRTAAGLMALVVLWVCVYWWWPSEPRISFAQPSEQVGDQAGVQAGTPAGGGPVAPAAPAPVERPKEPAPRAMVDGPEPRPSPITPQGGPPVAPSPTPAPKIIPPEFIDHTVERGETFGSISRRYFGTPKHASDIARANPLLDPARLRPGRVIRVPKDPENIQGKPAPTPSTSPAVAPGPGSVRYESERRYTVVAGDTLSRISQKMYGTQANTSLIFEANRNLLSSPDDLAIDQVLIIPPATGPTPPPG